MAAAARGPAEALAKPTASASSAVLELFAVWEDDKIVSKLRSSGVKWVLQNSLGRATGVSPGKFHRKRMTRLPGFAVLDCREERDAEEVVFRHWIRQHPIEENAETRRFIGQATRRIRAGGKRCRSWPIGLGIAR